MEIYIRPLEIKDALISYKWRNDKEIWKFTGNRPNIEVTPEIETEWIRKSMQLGDSKRFAICLEESGLYVGNVQLTHITKNDARFHIFIGDKKYWGKGIAQKATQLILMFAKHDLKLKEIYLIVNLENTAAIKVYKKVGFVFEKELKEQMKIKFKDIV